MTKSNEYWIFVIWAKETSCVSAGCKNKKEMLSNPKPSSEVSNSTNAGVTADPCRRMSWGVVMETKHLTRVRGTVLPSADRTRLRLMRYWPLSSAGVAKTLSGPKPSVDIVILSVESG